MHLYILGWPFTIIIPMSYFEIRVHEHALKRWNIDSTRILPSGRGHKARLVKRKIVNKGREGALYIVPIIIDHKNIDQNVMFM